LLHLHKIQRSWAFGNGGIMKTFFISFSNSDLPLASFIRDYFSDLFQGSARFFLADAIEPSDRWLDSIRDAISNADGSFFLLTPTSISQEWVNIEFGAVWILGKQIFPLVGGGLTFGELHRPFNDFQATTLTDKNSVSLLIRKLSTMCGLPNPPAYDAVRFCDLVQKNLLSGSAFRDLVSVTNALSINRTLIAERLNLSNLEKEPNNLTVQALNGDTLCVSGKLYDVGLIVLPFSSVPSVDFIVVQISNVEGVRSCFCNQMVKLVINGEPMPPMFQKQRHPRDSQYVRKENGFFVYSLQSIELHRDFLLKLIFFKCELERVLFRFYFCSSEAHSIRTNLESINPAEQYLDCGKISVC
jgi:hypothetical protein